MSERYVKLFSLPENLYAEGSPMIISAGNLLKDGQTGRVLAQLKIKNISVKPIKAATVVIRPLDVSGKPMGGDTQQQYLDINAANGQEFGQKTAVYLPDASARGFTAELTQAVFADNSVWEGDGSAWEALPEAESLEQFFRDAELVKQYRLQYGKNCRFVPRVYKDLWFCDCGTWNRKENFCRCGKSIETLRSLNIDALQEERDARVAAEQKQRAALAAERARKAKKAKKRGLIAGIILLVVLIGAAVGLYGLPALFFMQGSRLEKEGDYLAATEKYKQASGFALYDRDGHARRRISKIRPAAYYQTGEIALSEGRYLDAYDAFCTAGDHEDAAERAVEAAESLIETELAAGLAEDPAKAAERCRALSAETGDEKLSRILRKKAVRHYLDADDPDGAKALVQALFKDSAFKKDHLEEYGELRLLVARWYLDQGDIENALFNASMVMEDYVAGSKDLSTERKDVLYRIALGYYELGKYTDALRALSSAGEYRDASSLALRAKEMVKIDQFRSMLTYSRNYDSALYNAKDVNMNVLTEKERDAFRSELYDAGKTLENRGKDSEDYKYAFCFYKLSQKDDYESRMKVCNRKYMELPRVLTKLGGYENSAQYSIKGVTASYESGKVTFTVQYSASKNGFWSFEGIAWDGDEGQGAERQSGTIAKGNSSFSFTVSCSEEQSAGTTVYSKANGYRGKYMLFSEWAVYIFDNKNTWDHFASWYIHDRSFFRDVSKDLYDLDLA